MVKECIKKCSNCGHNGHNSRSCANKKNKEICVKIFGFKIHVSEKIESSISSSSSSSTMMRKSKSTPNLIASNNRANSNDDDGYLSDHGPGVREKKKGVPWTEDEHLSFLNGLEKLGKGDWKGISRNFVQSRTATQVASHAQKYFKRMSLTDKRNRRSSLFDMSLNEPEVNDTPPPEPPDTSSVKIPKLADKLPTLNVNQIDRTEEQSNIFAKADATPLTATSALPYTSCYGVPNFSQMPYFPVTGMTNNGQIYPGDKSFSGTMPSVPMMYIPNPAYFYLPKSPESQAQDTLFMPTYSHGSSSPMARP